MPLAFTQEDFLVLKMYFHNFFFNRIYSIQIQYSGHWTSVHGAAIGTRGEFLLADGETIVSVRYFVNGKRTNGMKFTTSSGRTYGPFGGDKGDEFMAQVTLLHS